MTALIMPICFPRPFVDESPIGYLIRVAQENSYKRVNWLYSDDSSRFMLTPHRLLEDLLEAHWSGFGEVSDSVKEICSLEISNLSFTYMRFCPKCLQEQKYHRVRWYLVGTAICLGHECWLVDKCPKCHSNISFTAGLSISECTCGASLLDAEVHRAPESAIRFARFFEGLPATKAEGYVFSNVFDGSQYTLANRVKLARILVRWSLSSSDLFHKTGNSIGLNSISAAKVTINSLSNSWFSSLDDFESYLITLHQKLYRDQSEGDELFRYFYKTVFREFLHPALEPIKEAIQSYMSENWIHSLDKRNSLFVKEVIEDHNWLPLQTASRELEVPKSQIKKGVDAGYIRHQLTKHESRTSLLVHRDDVIKAKLAKASYVNSVTAASFLGVTKKQMGELAKCGLVKKETLPGAPVFGAYSLDDLQELINTLNTQLITVEKDTLSLAEAVRKIGNGVKDPFVSLIQALLSGEIKAELSSNCIGFRRLRIDVEELKQWYATKTQFDTNAYFTMQSLRRYFQVSSDLIPQLVHKGLIRRVSATINNRHRMISIDAVNQFKERYVLLSKLSLCSSISSAVLMKKFTSNSIFPIDRDWPTEERLVQKVYYRYELLSVREVQTLIASMADWEYETF